MFESIPLKFDFTESEKLSALALFYNLGTRHTHSAARVAAGMLLGLYNGERFPFDLTDLRRLDRAHFIMAMALLEMDYRPSMEVHAHLNRVYGRTDFGMRFEHMAHRWRIKGRCKKEYLQPVEIIGELQIGGAQ